MIWSSRAWLHGDREGLGEGLGGIIYLYDSPRFRYNKQEHMSKLAGGKT